MNINIPFFSLLLTGTIAATSLSYAGFGDEQDEKIEDGTISLYVGKFRECYDSPNQEKALTFRDGRRFAATFNIPPQFDRFHSHPFYKGDSEVVRAYYQPTKSGEQPKEFSFEAWSEEPGGSFPIYDKDDNIIGYDTGVGGYTEQILDVTLKLMEDEPSSEKAAQDTSLSGGEESDVEDVEASLGKLSLTDACLNELSINQIRNAVAQGIISQEEAFTMSPKELYDRVMATSSTAVKPFDSEDARDKEDPIKPSAKAAAPLDAGGNGFDQYGDLHLTLGNLKKAYKDQSFTLHDGTQFTVTAADGIIPEFSLIEWLSDNDLFIGKQNPGDEAYNFVYDYPTLDYVWDEVLQKDVEITSGTVTSFALTFKKVGQ